MSSKDEEKSNNASAADNTNMAKSSTVVTKGRLSRKTASFFTILYACRRIFSIPYHLLSNIIPSRRANPTWSYKQAIGVILLRISFQIIADRHCSAARSLVPGTSNNIFARLEPAAADLYQGPLVSPVVKPVTIPAFWVPSTPPYGRLGNNTLVLHFHSGAYVSLSARLPLSQKPLPFLCKKIGSAFALCADYRKASDPGYSHFPAQLQDAVTAYSHALKLVESPQQIILSGDSAGGHLVSSLIRYLEQFQILPMPKAALLHSPWVNLTAEAVTAEKHRYGSLDFLPTPWLEWGASSFTPPGVDRDNEWISPVFHPFKTSIPIWVQVGEKEIFVDDIENFVSGMKSQGTHIELWTIPNAVHDVFGAAEELGMEKEESDAIDDAVRFLHTI